MLKVGFKIAELIILHKITIFPLSPSGVDYKVVVKQEMSEIRLSI